MQLSKRIAGIESGKSSKVVLGATSRYTLGKSKAKDALCIVFIQRFILVVYVYLTRIKLMKTGY